MEKKIILFTTLLSLYSIIESKQKGSSKTDSANIVSIDLPAVKIHNLGAKKASITGITIDYKITGEKEKKSVTTAAHIPLPSKKGKTFTLKLKLPTTSSEKSLSAEPLGISKIKVDANIIDISPPWTGLSDESNSIAGSEKIFITQSGSSWELDKTAMLKSAENKGNPKKKDKTKTKKTNVSATVKTNDKHTSAKPSPKNITTTTTPKATSPNDHTIKTTTTKKSKAKNSIIDALHDMKKNHKPKVSKSNNPTMPPKKTDTKKNDPKANAIHTNENPMLAAIKKAKQAKG